MIGHDALQSRGREIQTRRHQTPKKKRESESYLWRFALNLMKSRLSRISAPGSRSGSPSPSKSVSPRSQTRAPSPPHNMAPTTTDKPPNPQIELELETDTTNTVEGTIAERRARRLAIRAKYAGIESTSLSAITTAAPSPGIHSAASLPPLTPSEADLASHNRSTEAPPATGASGGEGTTNGIASTLSNQ